MIFTPLLNQTQHTRRQTAFYYLTRINRDHRFKIAVLRVKVRWGMIVVIHRYDDPQESANLGQSVSPYLACALTNHALTTNWLGIGSTAPVIGTPTPKPASGTNQGAVHSRPPPNNGKYSPSRI